MNVDGSWIDIQISKLACLEYTSTESLKGYRPRRPHFLPPPLALAPAAPLLLRIFNLRKLACAVALTFLPALRTASMPKVPMPDDALARFPSLSCWCSGPAAVDADQADWRFCRDGEEDVSSGGDMRCFFLDGGAARLDVSGDLNASSWCFLSSTSASSL